MTVTRPQNLGDAFQCLRKAAADHLPEEQHVGKAEQNIQTKGGNNLLMRT